MSSTRATAKDRVGGNAEPAAVGYLTKRFPRLSETFILDEILSLEAAGVPLVLFAMGDAGEVVVQPGVARVASPVTYLRNRYGWRSTLADARAMLSAHARLLAGTPRRYLTTLVRVMLTHHSPASIRHFGYAGRLAVLLRQSQVRHLHAAFAHSPASVAYFVHLLTGVPFSFAAHAKDLYRSNPAGLKRRACAASFVLVCSESAARDLTALSGPQARIVLAHHGVDVEQFVPAQDEHQGRSGPVRMLAVGRLVQKKGYPVLLRSLAELSAMGVPVTCTIIGAGPLLGELADRIDSLGLGQVVTLVGARSQPKVAAAYRNAEVFVQASVVLANGDRDGIPNSVLEAMASGLTVVCSAVAGIPEVIVDNVTGMLVPPGDSVLLAEALARVAGDSDLRQRLGAAARAYVQDHLDRAVCGQAIAALFTPPSPAGADAVPAPRAERQA